MNQPHPLNACLRFRQEAHAIEGDRDNVRITGKCTFTGKDVEIAKVPMRGLIAWAERRAKSQDAFPGLSADEREFLQSGTGPGFWDARCVDMGCDID